MSLIYEGLHLVFKVAGMGPYDNNGYVIADPKSKEAYLIDAPEGIEMLLHEAAGFNVKGLIITHAHPDHVAGYGELKRLTDIPVAVHESDIQRFPGTPDIVFSGKQHFRIGKTIIQVLHTPGHTPGATCLYCSGTLISGDTLFPGGPGRTENPKAFSEILSLIESNYVESVESNAMIDGAIKGMVKSLDPHTSYMPPASYKQMQVETTGKFGGLGIEISIRDGVLTVVSPIEDTPAFKVGIKPLDKIIKIVDVKFHSNLY